MVDNHCGAAVDFLDRAKSNTDWGIEVGIRNHILLSYHFITEVPIITDCLMGLFGLSTAGLSHESLLAWDTFSMKLRIYRPSLQT